LRVDSIVSSDVLASPEAAPMSGLRDLSARLEAKAIEALASSCFTNLRRLRTGIDAAGLKAIVSAANLPRLNRLALFFAEDVKPAAATVARLKDRATFPHLGQLWIGSGTWGKANLAPLLARDSVPWLMMNSECIQDERSSERVEQRAEKLGGEQAPLDDRWERSWDGE
jgi:hypothetical protein